LENSQWPAKSVTQRSATAWGDACKYTNADGTATSFSSVTVTRIFWDGFDPGGLVEVWAREKWTRKIQPAKQMADVRNR
jgi:hypothetical protein